MLDESITLEEVAVSKERALLPIEYCVKGLEQIILPQNEIEKLKHGQIVPLHKSAEGTENIAVLNYNRKLQAIAVIYNSNNESFLKPKKVFNME
jgi:tRNA U55 pseudouridine synthase TruB